MGQGADDGLGRMVRPRWGSRIACCARGAPGPWPHGAAPATAGRPRAPRGYRAPGPATRPRRAGRPPCGPRGAVRDGAARRGPPMGPASGARAPVPPLARATGAAPSSTRRRSPVRAGRSPVPGRPRRGSRRRASAPPARRGAGTAGRGIRAASAARSRADGVRAKGAGQPSSPGRPPLPGPADFTPSATRADMARRPSPDASTGLARLARAVTSCLPACSIRRRQPGARSVATPRPRPRAAGGGRRAVGGVRVAVARPHSGAIGRPGTRYARPDRGIFPDPVGKPCPNRRRAARVQ
jgi:hypothetical protein